MSKGFELAEQPLQIQNGKSTQKAITCDLSEQGIKDCLQSCALETANVVVWQVNKIRWGSWEQGVFTFADHQPAQTKLWLEVRVFNEDAELYLTRQNHQLVGRWRSDGQGEAAEYVDSMSRFWGEKSKEAEGWLTLADQERKLYQTVPAPGTGTQARFYGLVTRNYIGINVRTVQAGYEDYRYVAIVPADRKGDV